MIDFIELLDGEKIIVIVWMDKFNFGIRRYGEIWRCCKLDSMCHWAGGSYAPGIFFMWPFAMVVESGRYLRTVLAVRPGQEANWLLLMVLIHVDVP